MFVSKLVNFIKKTSNQNDELLWAKIWDDTKRKIEWIQDLPGISPGRWAVGYNYLYVMTRILNEKEPISVLECGLGISSTLISQYFAHKNQSGIHDIIEEDAEWASFYSTKCQVSTDTNIHVVKSVEKKYKGKIYNAYEDISGIVKGKRYDVISIDGPKGNGHRYARRDIIEYLPDILKESFIILLDDTQRAAEKHTVQEVKDILKQSGISFCEGEYPGLDTCTIITSKDNRFFCTM